MLRKLCLLCAVCAMCLVSCHNVSVYQPLWDRVDTLLMTYPDSALSVLEGIPYPENLSSYDYATYCLQLTGARLKNYVVQKSDTLIEVAVRYFDKTEDLKRKAEAYYYAGSLNNDLDNGDVAMAYFLKAKEWADQTNEYVLRGMIKYQLAKLRLYINQMTDALEGFKKANNDFGLGKDSNRVADAWGAIGHVYMCMQENDSAEFYFNKTLKFAEKHDLKDLIYKTESRLGNLCRQTGRYDLAVFHSRRGIGIIETVERNDSVIAPAYLILGKTFYWMGKRDSSAVYMKKALSGGLYTKTSANRYLYQIYQEQQDYRTTIRYMSDYIRCLDSIRIAYDEPRMKELELRYNTEKIERENERLQQDREMMSLWIVLLITGGALIVLGVCLFFSRRVLRQERELQSVRNEIGDYEQKYVQIEKEKEEKESEIDRLKHRLEEKERQLKETMSQDTPALQEEVMQVNLRIDQLKADIQRLSKKGIYLMDLLLKGSRIQNRIDDASVAKIEKRMTPELWKGIQEEINTLDPHFLKQLQKNAPSLKERDKQLCCLIKLNVSLDQMAALMQVDKRTISHYKSDIVRKNFNRTDKILLDILLRQL